MTHFDPTRRRFLKQTLAFSAASALAGATVACGSGINPDGGTGAPDTITANPGGHILMVGDWGAATPWGRVQDQKRVASAMATYASAHGLDVGALWMLGDNFYSALKSVDDTRWTSQFENMYPESSFPGPAWAIPGNHDYEVNPVAKYPIELDYAARGGTRFRMPAQWYSFSFPDTNPLIKVIALDSNMPFTPSPKNGFYGMTDSQRQEQLVFLEDTLAAPRTEPFLIVMGHHPLYSDGEHGDNAILIRDWDPLFRKYGVHAYVAGHDHDLQHLEFEGHPTSFFCSGGGGAALYDLKIAQADRGPYAQKVFGFSHLRVTSDQLVFRHLNANGNTLHKFTKGVDGKVTVLI